MNIFRLFSSTPVQNLASNASQEMTQSARKFISSLNTVKNMVGDKGNKVSSQYKKTENDAKELAKNATKGNLKGMLKNVKKLEEHSSSLFSAIGNPFNRQEIAYAKQQRENLIATAFRQV